MVLCWFILLNFNLILFSQFSSWKGMDQEVHFHEFLFPNEECQRRDKGLEVFRLLIKNVYWKMVTEPRKPGCMFFLTTAPEEFSQRIWEEAKHLGDHIGTLLMWGYTGLYLTGNYPQAKCSHGAQFLFVSQSTFLLSVSFFLPHVIIEYKFHRDRCPLCHSFNSVVWFGFPSFFFFFFKKFCSEFVV